MPEMQPPQSIQHDRAMERIVLVGAVTAAGGIAYVKLYVFVVDDATHILCSVFRRSDTSASLGSYVQELIDSLG